MRSKTKKLPDKSGSFNFIYAGVKNHPAFQAPLQRRGIFYANNLIGSSNNPFKVCKN